MDLRLGPRLISNQFLGRADVDIRFDDRWTSNRVVAHALGAIDGQPGTNSREAFEASYRRGFRAFEIDLIRTAEGKLAAKHDWNLEGSPWEIGRFLSTPIRGRFSGLDGGAIGSLLAHHPDAYLITDTKEDILDLLPSLITEIGRQDPSALKRIVPQIYAPGDLIKLQKVHKFESVIYTLYRFKVHLPTIESFVRRNGIGVVCLPADLYSASIGDELRRAGAKVYVHTVNDRHFLAKLRCSGVAGVYTDFLSPEEIEVGHC